MRTRVLILIAIAFIACQKQEPTPEPATTSAPPATTSSTPAAAPAQVPQIATGLQTPESVLYDATQDIYFISNINGQPLAADNNGYISRVVPDTLQIDAKWIEAGKNGVTLNAPKGMAVANGTLYVSDLTVVRKFDAKTGAPKGEIAIPGSTFLNDVAADGSTIYVTDTGMKAGAGGNFEPTGTDAVWKITGDKPEKIASGKDLKAPNGVEVVNGKVWVVSFGANELYGLDKGKKYIVSTLPKGGLDGLIHMSDDSFLVSSWDGKAVYRGKPGGGGFTAVLENVNAPADIGYDTKRHMLLVPHFQDSIVTLHPIQ
jgi:sugar lactone lactonase YvrE